MQAEYEELSEKAMKLMIPFATSYFCETRISAVAMIEQMPITNKCGLCNERGMN
jgi:hypothetical protein